MKNAAGPALLSIVLLTHRHVVAKFPLKAQKSAATALQRQAGKVAEYHGLPLPTTLAAGSTLCVAQLQVVGVLHAWWVALMAQLLRLWTMLLTPFAGVKLVGLSGLTPAANDRMDGNVWQWLASEPHKKALLTATLAAPALQSPALRKKADASHLPITPHLAYRYLAAADWADNYNGKPVAEAIAATVAWRDAFGIARLDPSGSFAHLVKSGLGYVGPKLDKRGRTVIYMKVGRVGDKLESNALYQQVLMYTVERAERLATHKGRGEFVTVIDLAGFNFGKNGLPFSTIQECMNLLKLHYPYRCAFDPPRRTPLLHTRAPTPSPIHWYLLQIGRRVCGQRVAFL